MCKTICKLCKHLVISQGVTFVSGTGLIIDIPAGAYTDGEKYCIVVAQTVPAETTITAPVFISIGGNVTTLYPLNNPCCEQVTACGIKTRTRYSTEVRTTTAGGSFNLLGRIFCYESNRLSALPVPTP